MVSLEKIIGTIQDKLGKLTTEEKRRLVLICTAGVVVILIVSVVISARNFSGEELSAEPGRMNIRSAIPAEEIFFPEEPDFLPEVLLEREQRLAWTEQDALEYWQDPLIHGEEQFRIKIETAIDEILERVP